MRGLALAFLALLVALPVRAQPATDFQTEARYVALMDGKTGEMFFARNADARIPPASMSKVMTLLVLFDFIKAGETRLDDMFTVSRDAWRRGGTRSGGSTMFLEPDSLVSVRDLIRGIVVASGNDAAIAVAENLAGSEPAFAEIMTARARELGMTGSHFANATGLPDPKQYMTARDLALLAFHTVRLHPTMFRFYADQTIAWGGVRQRNRNPLLGTPGLGVDGMKTGHTQEAGYCLLATAQRRGRRIILVTGGLDSKKARAQDSRKLLQWGFRAFESYPLFKSEDTITTLPIWHGGLHRMPVALEEDLTLTLSRRVRRAMRVEVAYTAPILAPVRAGDRLATLRVRVGEGAPLIERPLLALEDSARLGPFARAWDTMEFMLFGQ